MADLLSPFKPQKKDLFGQLTRPTGGLPRQATLFDSLTREPTEQDKSKFQVVLENLNRAGFGGVNMVRNLIRSQKQEEEFTPFRAFGKGFTLKETPFFGEVLKQDLNIDESLRNVGIEPETFLGKAVTGVAGFTGDVLLDPITYIPAGVFVKLLKGAGRVSGLTKLGKAIGKLPPVAQTGELLGRAFVPSFKLRKFPAFKESVRNFDTLMRNRQADIVDEVLTLAQDVAPAQRKLIRNFLEESDFFARSKLRSQLSAEGLAGKTAKIQKTLSDWAKKEKDLNVLGNIREFYAPHIRKDTERLVGSAVVGTRKIKPGFARARTIDDTIENINLQLGKEFFEKDIFKGLGVRGLAHSKAVTTTEFVNNTLVNFGRKVKLGDNLLSGEGLYVARDFFRRKPGAFVSTFFPAGLTDELTEIPNRLVEGFVKSTKGAEVFAMPREIAEHMNQFRRTFTNDEATKGFLRAYDGVLNLWKGYATGANLGFHGRNFISNYWLGFLRHGQNIFNPKANAKAMGILMAGSDDIQKTFPMLKKFIDKSTINTAAGKITYKQAFKLMRENRLLGRGWIGADIPAFIDRQLAFGLGETTKRITSRLNPLSQNNFLLAKIGRPLGQNVENHARALQFVLGLEKGEDIATSAFLTRKFLFDYTELTKFEQNVMKRIVPFYTWMRKNIPLQFEQMLKQPAKYTALIKAKGEIERDINVPTHMPDFIRSGFPIFAAEDIQGRPEAFVLRNFIPAADIEQIIGSQAQIAGKRVPEIVRTALTSVSPLIRSPIEQALNVDIFFNRPIERFPGETERVLGVPVRRRVAKELPRPFGEITRLFGLRRQEIGAAQPSAKARALRFATGLKGFPVEERRVRRQKQFEAAQKEREVKSALRSAVRRGDEVNIKRALVALRELRKGRRR